MSPRVLVALFAAALLAGCSSKSVSLEGRTCSTSADCIGGYTCVGGVCLSGDDGDGNQPIGGDITIGAYFTVDTTIYSADSIDAFPVLLNLDSAHLAGDLVTDDGSNLRFIDPVTTLPIPYDLATWNPDGVSQIWLQLDHIIGTRRIAIAYLKKDVDAPADNGWTSDGYVAVYHFEKSDPAADSSGATGSLSTAPTTTVLASGNGLFTPASGETAQVLRTQTDPAAVTVELYELLASSAWSRRHNVGVSPAPAVEGYQVPIEFSSAANRIVLDSNGGSLDVWSEPLESTTELWARTATGTSALTVYEGPVVDVPEAGITHVMDAGISYLEWTGITPPPAPPAYTMQAYFDALALTTPSIYSDTTRINCSDASIGGRSPCPLGDVDNVAAFFYGWLTTTKGDYFVGTNSDDASDVTVGFDAFEPAATPQVTMYQYEGTKTFARTGAATFPGGPTRYRYRYLEKDGNEAYIGTLAGSNVQTSSDSIDASLFHRRKLVATPSVSNITSTTVLGSTISEAGDLQVYLTPAAIRVEVGRSVLEAPADPATNHYVVLTVEGMNAVLYVDGVAGARGTLDTALVGSGRQLLIGDITADAVSAPAAFDELRFANATRNAAWVAAQAANLRNELVTFE